MWTEHLGALMDTLPMGVVMVGRGGNLIGANRTGLDWLGLDEAAKSRSDFLDLVESDTLRHVLAAPARGVVKMDIPDHGRTWHAEVRPIPGAEETGKLLLLRDVTGLSNVSLLRMNFVYDLLHRLRTPLTTVMSVLSMTTSGRIDPTRPDFGQILGMGAEEAERLAGLLESLKDLFLIEAGTLRDELLPEEVSVSELMKTIGGRFRVRTKAKKQNLIVDLPEPDLTAIADRECLLRVLEIVVANAHLYTPEGGTIRISAQGGKSHTTLVVADDGPGVPEEELPKVFDRLRRGESSYVQSVPGEGLGLYLARAMLGAQKGTILMDSKPGAGTVVELTLPTEEGT